LPKLGSRRPSTVPEVREVVVRSSHELRLHRSKQVTSSRPVPEATSRTRAKPPLRAAPEQRALEIRHQTDRSSQVRREEHRRRFAARPREVSDEQEGGVSRPDRLDSGRATRSTSEEGREPSHGLEHTPLVVKWGPGHSWGMAVHLAFLCSAGRA
jgi:hypothetical protein